MCRKRCHHRKRQSRSSARTRAGFGNFRKAGGARVAVRLIISQLENLGAGDVPGIGFAGAFHSFRLATGPEEVLLVALIG